MLHLAFILASLLLFFGFLALTAFEERQGVRIGASFRNQLDAQTTRVLNLLSRVDIGTFLLHLVKDLFNRLTHDGARLALSVVRFLERLLTQAVRAIREKHNSQPLSTQKETSGFVRTIAYFKQTLRKSHRTPETLPPPTPPAPDSVG